MENIITEENIQFLTFVSGIIVGSSFVTIIFMLIGIVRRNLCDAKENEKDSFVVSDPVLNSTTFRMASIDPRLSTLSTQLEKPLLDPDNTLPTNQICTLTNSQKDEPLVGENRLSTFANTNKEICNSPLIREKGMSPAIYSSPSIDESRLSVYTKREVMCVYPSPPAIYSSPSIDESRLSNTKNEIYHSPLIGDKGIYSSPPAGQPVGIYSSPPAGQPVGIYSSPPVGEPRPLFASAPLPEETSPTYEIIQETR